MFEISPRSLPFKHNVVLLGNMIFLSTYHTYMYKNDPNVTWLGVPPKISTILAIYFVSQSILLFLTYHGSKDGTKVIININFSLNPHVENEIFIYSVSTSIEHKIAKQYM